MVSHSLVHLRMSVFEFGDAAAGGAAEFAVGQLGEPALYEVEPGAAGRGEVLVEAGVVD